MSAKPIGVYLRSIPNHRHPVFRRYQYVWIPLAPDSDNLQTELGSPELPVIFVPRIVLITRMADARPADPGCDKIPYA